ncbi:hypothetical protein ABIF90_000183 [Bradyrhizobium japonicum]
MHFVFGKMSFNHLVCAAQDGSWKHEAERLRNREVDYRETRAGRGRYLLAARTGLRIIARGEDNSAPDVVPPKSLRRNALKQLS